MSRSSIARVDAGDRRPGFLAALLACAFLASAPHVAAAEDATGLWRTEATAEGYLEVRIAACDGAALCGTILRARDLQGREQPYPHTGRQMIWDMAANGSGSWTDGRIWDPRNDRTFRARMDLAGDRLVVAGCVLGICQRQTWQRLD